MPPRKDFKTYNLCLRTHKVGIMFTADASAKVSTLVPRVYSALEQFDGTFSSPIPSTQELEPKQIRLAKIKRDDAGKPTPKQYDPLDENATIKDQLQNWENVFVMFPDIDGNYRVVVELPSLQPEE